MATGENMNSLQKNVQGLVSFAAHGVGTCIAILFALGVHAAVPHFAVADQISRGLANHQPQVVIVELEASAIQAQGVLYRKPDKPDMDSAEALAFKATRFMALKQQVTAALDMTDIELNRDYSHLPMLAMRVGSTAALNRLLARPEVIAIHENVAHYPTLAESLPLIGQPSVAAAGYTGAGTTVAVLDSGTDYRRAAFGSCSAPGANCKVVVAMDFAPNDGVLDDGTFHGTNVAGIVLGVAPGAKIAALDVFSADGYAWSTDIIAAINWAIANKATYNIVAINLSLGNQGWNATQCSSSYAATPFASARNAGILPVVSAGNDGYSTGLSEPACAPGAVSVGAIYDSNVGAVTWSNCTDLTTTADKIACFSDSASYLTLFAPGAWIDAAGIQMGGTSQAAPHVAGAVALLRAKYPADSLDQTVSRMTASGTSVLDPRNGLTKPRLNLATALTVDGIPDPFTFTSQVGVALSTTVTSEMIAVSGINAPATISVSGGTYSINGGGYTSTASTVNNGNTVTVRLTSASSYGTQTCATLTIGGVTGTFCATTLAAVDGTQTLWFVPPASDTGHQGFIRITNSTGTSTSVSFYGIDDAGNRSSGTASFTLGPQETKQFNSTEIETGAVAKGLTGALGTGSGNWRLVLASPELVEATALIRVPNGFLTSVQDADPNKVQVSTYHVIPTVNPAVNTVYPSVLRFVNPNNTTATVHFFAYENSGQRAPAFGSVGFTIGANRATNLTSAELESGAPAKGLASGLGPGIVKWRITASSDVPIKVMNLSTSPSGYITELPTETMDLNEAGYFSCADFEGAMVFSQDDLPVYLGFFGNSLASASVNNPYGSYGSSYSYTSMRSPYSTYGSASSNLSAANPNASKPPLALKNSKIFAAITANPAINGRSLVALDTCTFNSSQRVAR